MYRTISTITQRLLIFRSKRKWEKFHTPENLAKSVSIESAELLELYQWGNNPEETRIKEEIADVLIYLFYMCDHYDFNILGIMQEKIEKNNIKYPDDVDHAKLKGWDK